MTDEFAEFRMLRARRQCATCQVLAELPEPDRSLLERALATQPRAKGRVTDKEIVAWLAKRDVTLAYWRVRFHRDGHS